MVIIEDVKKSRENSKSVSGSGGFSFAESKIDKTASGSACKVPERRLRSTQIFSVAGFSLGSSIPHSSRLAETKDTGGDGQEETDGVGMPGIKDVQDGLALAWQQEGTTNKGVMLDN